MDPSRVDRILKDWSAIASQARRPAAPPRGMVLRSGLPTSTLAGAGLAVAALVVAVLWFGGRAPNGSGGIPPTSPDPTAAATPSPVPTMGPCDPASLPARIILWEGAAGHRIARVELSNAGPSPCTMPAMARPQLVDGAGMVLIDGANPTTSDVLTMGPGDLLTTLVQDGNYCGPAAVAPVSVAFVLSDGGRIVADPYSATDATVPPCLGAPGSAGTIEMQPWAAQ